MEKQFKWLFFPFLVLSALPLFWGLTALSVVLLNIVFAYYTARYGLQFSAFGLVIFFFASAFSFGIQSALLFCLQILPALVLGILLFKKAKFSTLLIVSTIAELVVLVVQTHFISKTLALEPADWLFQDAIQTMNATLLSATQIDPAMVADTEMVINKVANMLQMMLPCFYILFSVCAMYILFNIVRFILKKQNIQLDTMPQFHELWLSKSISVLFVVLFLISMFTDSPIIMNVVSVMFTIHVVCGLSFVDFYLLKHKMPKIVRVLILGVLVTLSSLIGGLSSSILCCMGMRDGMQTARK